MLHVRKTSVAGRFDLDQWKLMIIIREKGIDFNEVWYFNGWFFYTKSEKEFLIYMVFFEPPTTPT